MLAPPKIDVITAEQRLARIVTYYRRRSTLDASASAMSILDGSAPAQVAELLAHLDPAWFDHAVASVYASLMGKRRRKALGAYFTPPDWSTT